MKIKGGVAIVGAALIGCAAMMAATAEAPAQPRKEYVTTRTRGPANRPRARVVVPPRSFLDAGTEVVPGERKFTDYAFPPTYTPLGTVTNTGGKVGWDRSPMMQPWELPGGMWRW
ncbi:MAG TPA: hypothetical protein VGF60_04160 [Xanthobacteraceae bacterium]|jgi:hypothetical protein